MFCRYRNILRSRPYSSVLHKVEKKDNSVNSNDWQIRCYNKVFNWYYFVFLGKIQSTEHITSEHCSRMSIDYTTGTWITGQWWQLCSNINQSNMGFTVAMAATPHRGVGHIVYKHYIYTNCRSNYQFKTVPEDS